MTACCSLAVAVYTILGGMLSVLVTDFLQFVVMSVGLIAVTVLHPAARSAGTTLVATVETHYGAAASIRSSTRSWAGPTSSSTSCLNTAAVLTWQTTIARVLAAKDTKTGRQVYTRTSFFFVCRFLIPGIWGIAALAVLTPAPWSAANTLATPCPMLLSQFVPVGLMGLLVAAMLAADMSTDSSYMLTWGERDLQRHPGARSARPSGPEKKGLLWNRMIVAVIGVFLLFYGLWYPLKGDLWTYLGVTGTIYLSSMSVLLIACCYWKRANNWGAAAAIVFGAVIPVTFLVLEQLPATAALAKKIGPYYSGIAAYCSCGLAMIVGSLLKPQPKVPALEGGSHA